MKKTLLLFLFICCTFFTQAQFAITLNGAGAMPVGDFGNIASFGYGGGGGLHYFFQDQGSIGLNVNYLSFQGKNNLPNSSIISVTPTMLFSFFMDNSPYLIIDAGGYFANFGGITNTSSYGGAIGLGYLYGLTDIMALSINAKYTAAYDFDNKVTTMYAPVNVGLLFILGGTGKSLFTSVPRRSNFTNF
jgi:hypothetical protein